MTGARTTDRRLGRGIAEIQAETGAAWHDVPDTSDVTWPTRSQAERDAEFRAKLAGWVKRMLGLSAACWLLSIGIQGLVIGPTPAEEKVVGPLYHRDDVPASWRYP